MITVLSILLGLAVLVTILGIIILIGAFTFGDECWEDIIFGGIITTLVMTMVGILSWAIGYGIIEYFTPK